MEAGLLVKHEEVEAQPLESGARLQGNPAGTGPVYLVRLRMGFGQLQDTALAVLDVQPAHSSAA